MSSKELFQIEKLGFSYTGMSLDNDGWPYKIYTVIVIIIVCLYTGVLFLGLITQPFKEAVDGWVTFCGYFMTIVVLFTTLSRRKEIGALLNRLKDPIFQPSEDAVILVEKWRKRKNFKVMVYLICLCGSMLSQTIYCLILRIIKADPNEWKLGLGTLTLVNTTYSPNYEIAFTYQNVSLFYIATFNLTIMFIIFGVLEFVATQCKILQLFLKDIDDSNTGKIEKFVVYHNSVIKLVGELEALFSQMILFFFVGIVATLCIEIYRMSLLPLQSINTLRVFLETFTVSIQMFFICLAGENMTRESENITNAVFGIDFVGTDVRFQKFLLIIMCQSNKPLRFKAGKLIEISLMNFALVLRTSYSAYAMLKNVNV